jgi:hypothetical protein
MRGTDAQPSLGAQAPSPPFNGVKVFSATMMRNREQLGERVSEWIGAHHACRIVDIVVTQSSDAQFHCIAVTLFYLGPSETATR